MRQRQRALAKALLAVLSLAAVGGLFALQVADTRLSAGRRLAYSIDAAPPGLVVGPVTAGGPADRAGIRPGDVVRKIAGQELRVLTEYDRVAAEFRAGVPVTFEVEREGKALAIEVVPGMAPDWGRTSLDGLLVAAYLALALLALAQREGDLRGRLLFVFGLLLAIESARPWRLVGQPRLSLAMDILFYAVTGAQIGVELHLASVIPDRPRWLDRRRWVVPAYYLLGLGFGTVAGSTYVLEELGYAGTLGWTSTLTDALFFDAGLTVWAAAVVVLLGTTATRHPEPQGRQQAGLVLLGVLPWAAYVFAITAYQLAGAEAPPWLERVLPILLLAYPAAIFVAIFRYHLFDLEIVVRRSLVYTALTTLLLLVFYGALGAGGALVSQWVDAETQSIWVVSAATLLLGLLFAPLRRTVQAEIDRRFFPERNALRQRLVDLASELPALGKTQRMAEHLATSLRALFGVKRAAVLLADPRTGMLWTVASGEPEGESPLPSFILPPDDPAVERLRQTGRPLEVARLAREAPELVERLRASGAELLVPLVNGERLVGILVLGRRAWRSLRAEERELLSLLAQHVATVFENVRLFESATYESLTGLLRREAIQETLDHEVERARRYRRPLAVGLADLDHFKAVNDQHGHLAGDAVLRRVAQELASGLRGTDVIGRWGGEEFLMVFPETEVHGAIAVAEKLRRRLEALAIRLDGGAVVHVRVSIGLAALDDVPGDLPDAARALVEFADRALYRAKDGGRNRVEPALAAAGAR